jgi:hypothetical protein
MFRMSAVLLRLNDGSPHMLNRISKGVAAEMVVQQVADAFARLAIT